jgi:hypothetical protein
MGHVAAQEPTSAGRRGSGAEEHVAALELNSAIRQGPGHGRRSSAGAYLGRKTRSGAAGYVEVLELTSIGRRGPELQGT